ncbi:methylglutaconyl-CoA hydratase, mitochondrial-like [Oppia nitens]|uniref:methylglutaconyl-CoA hydratase, mitochondrial-like n=1 Tax=Oppia nitens TaxID=1686743 RepID=UPI0023DBDA22|nr:methylglutaconyl-CoA hydratase, mitochondrial-like [Oppia nitens]
MTSRMTSQMTTKAMNSMTFFSLRLLQRRPGIWTTAKRSVIGTSHASQRDDEVFASKLMGSDAGIVVLSLNRPNGANSLSRTMASKLNESLYQLSKDEELRVLIVRSVVAGIFCAGADLKERATMHEKDIPPFVAKLRSIANAIHDFPVPVIAAIDGAAIGGGLEYALAADLRVAASNAKLGLVETKLAVIPGAGGTQRLSRLIPIHLAKELIFTGKVIDGHSAAAIGLVNYSVEQNAQGDAAYRRAVKLAEEMISNGPIALRAAKVAINKGIEVDLHSGLAIEASCHSLCVHTKDRLEGLASFKEKRAPKYRGE